MENIPTLAYRVAVGDHAIVFGTDQTGTDPRFVEFARGADLLVLHMTVGVGVMSSGGSHVTRSRRG